MLNANTIVRRPTIGSVSVAAPSATLAMSSYDTITDTTWTGTGGTLTGTLAKSSSGWMPSKPGVVGRGVCTLSSAQTGLTAVSWAISLILGEAAAQWPLTYGDAASGLSGQTILGTNSSNWQVFDGADSTWETLEPATQGYQVVSFTHRSDGTFDFYVNGVLAGSTTVTWRNSLDTALIGGWSSDYANANTTQLDGTFGAVEMTPSDLNAAQHLSWFRQMSRPAAHPLPSSLLKTIRISGQSNMRNPNSYAHTIPDVDNNNMWSFSEGNELRVADTTAAGDAFPGTGMLAAAFVNELIATQGGIYAIVGRPQDAADLPSMLKGQPRYDQTSEDIAAVGAPVPYVLHYQGEREAIEIQAGTAGYSKAIFKGHLQTLMSDFKTDHPGAHIYLYRIQELDLYPTGSTAVREAIEEVAAESANAGIVTMVDVDPLSNLTIDGGLHGYPDYYAQAGKGPVSGYDNPLPDPPT